MYWKRTMENQQESWHNKRLKFECVLGMSSDFIKEELGLCGCTGSKEKVWRSPFSVIKHCWLRKFPWPKVYSWEKIEAFWSIFQRAQRG